MWLNDLQKTIDVESLSALQAKSVATTPESFEALSIRNAQVSIRKMRLDSVEIIDSIDNYIDHLPITLDDLIAIKKDFLITCNKICSVIEVCRMKGCDFVTNKKISVTVASICHQTVKFINSFIHKKNVNNAQLEATLRKLKENFGELVDITIRRECQVCITLRLKNLKT